MSKNRNYRLRKKLRHNEFVEYGFEIKFACSGMSEADLLVALTIDILESRRMAFVSENVGQVFISGLDGSLSEEDLDAVKTWLQSHGGIASFEVGPLIDAWHPPRSARCFEIPRPRSKTLLLLAPINS